MFYQVVMQVLAVYPCVYREHYIKLLMVAPTGGLSLCIQGTRLADAYFYNDDRFIPVYTGNTTAFCTSFSTVSVYPCVYREHENNHTHAVSVPGLSLCIQGTLQL